MINGRIKANMQREIKIPDNVMAIIDRMMRAGVGREKQLYYLAQEHKIVLTVAPLRKKHRQWCEAKGMDMPPRVVTNEMRDKMSESAKKRPPEMKCSNEEKRRKLGLVPVRFDYFVDCHKAAADKGTPKERGAWL